MKERNFTSATFKADVSVTPSLSHSVLVVLIFVSVIPLIAGLAFLWYEKSGAWIPFSIFFVLIALLAIGWWKSQRSIDMGNASPTTIIDQKGNQILTDSRILESLNAVENIGILFQSIGVRQPLPEPDGVVDDTGEILEDSQSNAAKIADQINQKIKKSTDDFMQKMIKADVEITQNAAMLIEKNYEEILDHNQPAERQNS